MSIAIRKAECVEFNECFLEINITADVKIIASVIHTERRPTELLFFSHGTEAWLQSQVHSSSLSLMVVSKT